MKSILLIIIFCWTACSYGQTKTFKNIEELSQWMMNYYKNPEPHFLLDAFKYATPKKKIAKAGSRPMLMGFFSSSLSKDTIRQREFFNQLKDTNDEDYIYGYGLTLWYIHSEFSISLMDKFLGQERLKKYDLEFDNMRDQRFPNIWTDSIKEPAHLDKLWADFFATGNEASIRKIITKLADLKSNNQYDVVTANSARWSLASNSIAHDKVFEVCKSEFDTSDKVTSEALGQIISEAEKQRKKRG
jgi:hypothetical protein